MLHELGGVYLEDVEVAELAGEEPLSGGVKAYSLDETHAKQLWNLTEQLTGIKFKVV